MKQTNKVTKLIEGMGFKLHPGQKRFLRLMQYKPNLELRRPTTTSYEMRQLAKYLKNGGRNGNLKATTIIMDEFENYERNTK